MSIPIAPTAHPSQAVLADVLRASDEAAVADHLRISVRTLRRYATGTMRMNWVLLARLATLAQQRHKRERAA